MPIFYQNQSTVWYLGGENITFNGFGTGTFDGNGQTWYDFVKGKSNYPSELRHSAQRLTSQILKCNRTANGSHNIPSKKLTLSRAPFCSKSDVDNDNNALF
jgi:hypothetical protein